MGGAPALLFPAHYTNAQFPCALPPIRGRGRRLHSREDRAVQKGDVHLKAYAIGLYEKAMPPRLDWREMLDFARSCGYDFLELSIDETQDRLARLEWSAQQRLELVRAMDGAGLPIRSMCLSGHRKYPLGSSDPAVRRRGMEIMEKAICLADDLGIRIIQLAGYDVYYEEGCAETRARFLENLRRAVEMAAVKGVTLGFETMETDFMNTVWKAMFYVNAVNSPYLGVYPDVGNLTNAALPKGPGVLEDLESGRGHLVALHLKETVPGVFREVPFLTGHVDFPAVIEKAWSLGVRRYVTEMWYTGNDGSWAQDVRAACSHMSGLLDAQAGQD